MLGFMMFAKSALICGPCPTLGHQPINYLPSVRSDGQTGFCKTEEFSLQQPSAQGLHPVRRILPFFAGQASFSFHDRRSVLVIFGWNMCSSQLQVVDSC